MRAAIDSIEIGPAGLDFDKALVVLANALKPMAGAPRVPDRDAFANHAAAIAKALFDKLEAALAADAPAADLEAIRKQIERLGNEVRVAGLVLGLLAPFKPKRRKSRIRFSIRFASGIAPAAEVKELFPWLETAINFLASKKVIKASEFASLSIDEQQKAFTAPGIEDQKALSDLRDEIAKGQNTADGGESLAEFRKRVGATLSLSRAQTETVFRTNVKQGYVSGFETSMKSPLVAEIFPAVMFSATEDNRVRATHWELDGFVCLKSDPAYKVLLRALKDWGCRCNPIPMTLEQAEAAGGLKTISDLRTFYPDVMKQYGEGL